MKTSLAYLDKEDGKKKKKLKKEMESPMLDLCPGKSHIYSPAKTDREPRANQSQSALLLSGRGVQAEAEAEQQASGAAAQ